MPTPAEPPTTASANVAPDTHIGSEQAPLERANSRSHEFSRNVIRRGEREGNSAEARLDAADARDELAQARDVAASARDHAADARASVAAKHDDAAVPPRGAQAATSVVIRAAGQRNRAARRRAHNAEQRTLAARDRRAAAEDRAQAAGERLHALVDREVLADQLAIADNDPLTGARTRAAGLTDLDRELDRCRRTSGVLVVAYVDVVGLKALNDSAGHEAGDDLLELVVRIMKEHLRTYDLVIRLGGDEFLCAMAGMTLEDARSRFAAIAGTLRARPKAIELRTGFAALTPTDTSMQLIARADSQLIDGSRGDHEPRAPRRPRIALHQNVRALPEYVAPLRLAVLELARVNRASDRQCEDIAVAVSEALNNVVLHAYAGHATPGFVELDAWISERMLDVVVSDEGGGMRPHAGSAALGFGFALMIRTTRRLEISESANGVRVRMRFEID